MAGRLHWRGRGERWEMTQKEQAEGGHVAKTTVTLPSLPLTFPKTDLRKSEFIAG